MEESLSVESFEANLSSSTFRSSKENSPPPHFRMKIICYTALRPYYFAFSLQYFLNTAAKKPGKDDFMITEILNAFHQGGYFLVCNKKPCYGVRKSTISDPPSLQMLHLNLMIFFPY